MYFLRALLASLLGLVCTLAVSAYVTLQTLNTTVLDRTEVKSWLDKSGVYNNLLNTTLANNQAAQNELNTGSSIVSSDSLKTGLNQTFTPSYVKQAAEKAIDGTYDWLTGSTSTISFEINTPAQKDAFISNLSAALEPQLAQLPRCTSTAQFNASDPTCLPPGTTAKEAANELATDVANQNSVFRQPITAATAAQSTANSGTPSNTSLTSNPTAQRAQSLVSSLGQWLLWLPIIVIVSGCLMVLLSRYKLRAAKHLAARLTVGLALTCAIGLLIATIGRTFSLKDFTSANSTIMSQVVEPVVHQAAPAIGARLALVSGIIGAVTLIAWIVLLIIKRKFERNALLKPDETLPTDDPTTLGEPAPAKTTEPNDASHPKP